MQYTLQEITRLSICPILYKKKWDYMDPSLQFKPTYLYAIREVFKWFYRRGKPITMETISASINHHAIQSNMSFEEKGLLETAVRRFVNETFYKEMEQPFFNKEIQAYMNDVDTLSWTVPVITRHNKKIQIITYNKGQMIESEYLRQYDIMFATLWAYNALNEMVEFVNIYQHIDEIVLQKFKITEKYIEESRQTLSNIGKSIKGLRCLPPMFICQNCIRRTECLQKKMPLKQ